MASVLNFQSFEQPTDQPMQNEEDSEGGGSHYELNSDTSALSTTTPTNSTTTGEAPRGMRTFEMRKQKRKERWQFTVCVADPKYADISEDKLRTKHAMHGWCKKCRVAVKIEKSKNHAKEHMMEYHPVELNEFLLQQEHAQAALAARAPQHLTNIYAGARSDPIFHASAASSDQEYANNLLSMWIASSLRPMSLVDDPGFTKYVNFVNSVDNKIHIPSRQTVTDRIRQKASELRASLQARLSLRNECEYFSVSSDIWTSMNAESFMSLTLHYLDEKFTLNGWTLEVTGLPGKHDAVCIAGALSLCFEKWGLSRGHCVRFLRDGGRNIKKACDDLGFQSLACAAHSLHLVVGAVTTCKVSELADEDWMSFGNDSTMHEVELDQESGVNVVVTDEEIDAICDEVVEFVNTTFDCQSIRIEDLEDVRKTVQRFRKLAVYFHRSQKGANRLKNLQPDHETRLRVFTDSPTRWGSTMLMLQRLIELRSALDDFFAYLSEPLGAEEFTDTRSRLHRPTSEEWFTIQCLVELLGPFSATTDELGGDKYPTLVHLIPGIRSLQSLLSETDIFDSLAAKVEGEPFTDKVIGMMESVRKSFIVLLQKRFGDLDGELSWIALLDPRFTNSELFSHSEMDRASERFIDNMVTTASAALIMMDNPSSPAPAATPDRPTPKKKQRVKYRRRLYGSRVTASAQMTTEDTELALLEECKWEFKKYLRDSATVHDDMDPLQWWSENRANFPRIVPLARKWLGCIATSVPSERAFSTAGNTVSTRRSSLNPTTVRGIVFIADNNIDM